MPEEEKILALALIRHGLQDRPAPSPRVLMLALNHLRAGLPR